MTRRLLIIVGMRREASIAQGDARLEACMLVCSGANPQHLRETLSLLDKDAKNFSGVLSFGLAGGLDPSLRSGALILADRVVEKADALPVSTDWKNCLAAQFRQHAAPFYNGDCLGSDIPLMTSSQKDARFKKTRALAVDMESHIAGAYAVRNRLPFAILRAVSDPAHRALPPIASQSLHLDGGLNMQKIISGVLRHPQQIPALIRAGRDSSLAFESLKKIRRNISFAPPS